MSNWAERIKTEVGKAVIGQDIVIERMLVALLANGHVLLEEMPGLAKTLLIRSLGTAIGLQFDIFFVYQGTHDSTMRIDD